MTGNDQDGFGFSDDYPHKEFSDDPPATPPHRMVRVTDPDTSHEMALMADTKTTKARVYQVIKSYGPAGCIMNEVLAAIPEWGYGRITPTFARLKEEGFIVDSGERRRAETGRYQIVLVASCHFITKNL